MISYQKSGQNKKNLHAQFQANILRSKEVKLLLLLRNTPHCSCKNGQKELEINANQAPKYANPQIRQSKS